MSVIVKPSKNLLERKLANLFIHALIGCDTTSALFMKSKSSFKKILQSILQSTHFAKRYDCIFLVYWYGANYLPLTTINYHYHYKLTTIYNKNYFCSNKFQLGVIIFTDLMWETMSYLKRPNKNIVSRLN